MFREAEILKTPNLHLSVVWYLERLHELLNQYKLILCGLSLRSALGCTSSKSRCMDTNKRFK